MAAKRALQISETWLILPIEDNIPAEPCLLHVTVSGCCTSYWARRPRTTWMEAGSAQGGVAQFGPEQVSRLLRL